VHRYLIRSRAAGDRGKIKVAFLNTIFVNNAASVMKLRMINSVAQINLTKHGAELVNLGGVHNPVMSRRIECVDIQSVNCFPIITSYYSMLECTFFCEEFSEDHLRL